MIFINSLFNKYGLPVRIHKVSSTKATYSGECFKKETLNLIVLIALRVSTAFIEQLS